MPLQRPRGDFQVRPKNLNAPRNEPRRRSPCPEESQETISLLRKIICIFRIMSTEPVGSRRPGCQGLSRSDGSAGRSARGWRTGCRCGSLRAAGCEPGRWADGAAARVPPGGTQREPSRWLPPLPTRKSAARTAARWQPGTGRTRE
jgi:hypothetical protein